MISVVIPVLNESPTIQSVIALARASQNVSEIIVVDDGSIDGTPELARQAGARVITSTLLGKGASMEDGVWTAQNELLVFLDGDLRGLREDLIERLAGPLLAGQADFVKARFSRAAGRVTMLTAKPLLNMFFPELHWIEQPLCGQIAAQRSLLRNLRFESDYGVDIGLLIDAVLSGASIQQVDIGHLEHESQSLESLGDMATQVARAILDRAARSGRMRLEQLSEAEEVDGSRRTTLDIAARRLGRPRQLAVFDMDGTLLRGRFAVRLAQRTNQMSSLEPLLDNPSIPAEERTRAIAALFTNVPKSTIEEVARHMPLTPGAVETVLELRRRGYGVGIVSDSFLSATEIIRRRVFADFSIAHRLRFRGGVATGQVSISPALRHPNGCPHHSLCKLNTLLHLADQFELPVEQILAVGDGVPDMCMLAAAETSFAFEPKTAAVGEAAKFTVRGRLDGILPLAPPRRESVLPSRA